MAASYDKTTKEFIGYGNPLNAVALTPMLTIPAGETLHVRLLPWHEHTSGSGKYICLYNLKIEGQAFEPKQEGIRTTQSVTPATKILRDGRLYILRNGVEYHVTGQRK